MQPAFSSSRQAVGFALLLALLLVLPALLARIHWGDRRELYASIPNTYGPYPWIEKKIFTETNDVDIAFLGSSHLWYGVDTPYVQEKLGQQLHRKAEVFTLGWNWAGYDILYLIAHDLLDHRRVHTIVIHDEHPKRDIRNFHATFRYWYRVGEASDMLTGLGWSARVRLYAIAVTGAPRQILNLLRANPVPTVASEVVNVRPAYRKLRYMDDPAGQLGAACCRGRMTDIPDVTTDSFMFQPTLDASPADMLVYSEQAHNAFSFSDEAVPIVQLHFARKLAQLCKERGTQLVILHMPAVNESQQTTVKERARVLEALDAPLVGIPGAKLFSGLPPPDLQQLFLDPTHLNKNGQELFTKLLAPTLLKLYAKPHQQ